MPECISQLHNIVSLAGGALALNLAYVNLERFRYAKTIQNSSKGALDQIEKDQELDYTNAESYQQLKGLVASTYHDKKDEPSKPKLGIKLCVMNILYRHLFSNLMDVYLCSLLVVVSVVALVLGSAHPIGVLDWTCPYFTLEFIHRSYWLLAASIAVPMLFLLAGGLIKRECDDLVHRIEADLGQVLKKGVSDAKLKDQSS